MICDKCGAPLPDDAVVCSFCGLPVEAPAQEPVEEADAEALSVEELTEEAPVQEWTEEECVAQSEEPLPEEGVEEAPKKKSHKGFWIAFIAVICTIALCAGTLLLVKPEVILPNQFQDMVDDYYSMMLDGDLSKLESLAPAEYWAVIEQKYGLTVNQLISNETCKNNMDNYVASGKEYYVKTYGNEWNYTVDVLCDHPYSEHTSHVKQIRESLQTNYSIDPSQVAEVRVMHVESKVVGTVDEVFSATDIYAVKIRDNWYMMSEDGFAVDYAVYYLLLQGIEMKPTTSTDNATSTTPSTQDSSTTDSDASQMNDATLQWD